MRGFEDAGRSSVPSLIAAIRCRLEGDLLRPVRSPRKPTIYRRVFLFKLLEAGLRAFRPLGFLSVRRAVASAAVPVSPCGWQNYRAREGSMERRLAAVLIADVAGYGRLSQADEEGTRARFQDDLHEVFEPAIAGHRGRLVKTMGDGLLVEFQSVVDALRCAVELQRAEAERNATLPLERRMEFRIGINLGDVIVEGDDIHGDGVNIADRMQALAEPGGIAISGTAYDHVKAKLPVGYASLGEQKVKSIADPVRVYRVLMDPAAAGKTSGCGAPSAPLVSPARGRRRDPAAGRRRCDHGVVAALAAGRGNRTSRNPWSPPVGQAVARGAPLRQPERGRGAGLSR